MKIFATILKPFRAHAARTAFVPTPAPDDGSAGRTSDAEADRAAPVDDRDIATAHAAASPGVLPQVVLLDCDVRDKREALDLAASTLERFHGVDAAPVARALWRREAAVSTALGEGVAVPHARIDGISEPVTLLIRTRRPIAYEAPDRRPVSQLFVILVPADGDADDHLRLLATVAQLFSQPAFRERVAVAVDTRAVHRAFAEFGDATGHAEAAPMGATPVSDPARACELRSRSR